MPGFVWPKDDRQMLHRFAAKVQSHNASRGLGFWPKLLPLVLAGLITTCS